MSPPIPRSTSRRRSLACRPRAGSSPPASSPTSRPGRSPSWPAIRTVPTRSTTSPRSARSSTSCTATACTPTIRRSSAALARIDGRPVMFIGHQKGRDTKERVRRNYGMPKPEGYRKALRLMRLAERFGLPLVTLIDTQGAYPGVGAEERGQSEAIARNLFEMSVLQRADRHGSDGRGRLGRRACHRRLRPPAHAAVQHLLGDLARGLRLDPVEEPGQEGGGRRGARTSPPTACRSSGWSTR